MENDNLREIASTLFDKSKKWLYASMSLQVFVFVLNIVSFFFDNNTDWKGYISLLNLCLVILIFFLIRKYKALYQLGEQVRKLRYKKLVMSEAITSFEYCNVIINVPQCIRLMANLQPSSDEDFATTGTPFNNASDKMIQDIQESCFFTSQLSKKVSELILTIIIIVTFIILFTLLFATNNVGCIQQLWANNLAQFLINLMISLNILDMYFTFLSKAKNLEQIDNSLDVCRNLENESNKREQINWLFMEYNCELTDALPIPDLVYKKHRNNLNEIWLKRTRNLRT